ncbi:hypothetical protein HAX54_033689 [Datura stramonium]|uniref:Uncharacterized protein n=1 Tax=Datura stramonium TaxID=4076 RepID=A0ABS8SDJ6_DATST|nr:hypothetical protein [Datura stramonium]
MHNPIEAITETSQWARDEEGVFSKLRVRPAKKEETYLAIFSLCWLCAFVLPSEEGDFIQPKTFKIATMMATKQKISLVVPVLARIYSGLSKISQSSQLDIISEVAPQGFGNTTPKTGNPSALMVMLSEQCKGNGPRLLIEAPTDQAYDQDNQDGKGSFPLSVVAHDSKKQSYRGESASSHEDHSWRKVKSRLNRSGDTDLAVLEISNSVDSPSRTLTSNCVGALPRGGSQESVDSVSGLNPIKSSPSVIRGKLFGSNVYCASSLKEDVQVILEEMDEKDVDDMEAARNELSIAARERFSNAMFEENEKIETTSFYPSVSKRGEREDRKKEDKWRTYNYKDATVTTFAVDPRPRLAIRGPLFDCILGENIANSLSLTETNSLPTICEPWSALSWHLHCQ